MIDLMVHASTSTLLVLGLLVFLIPASIWAYRREKKQFREKNNDF